MYIAAIDWNASNGFNVIAMFDYNQFVARNYPPAKTNTLTYIHIINLFDFDI